MNNVPPLAEPTLPVLTVHSDNARHEFLLRASFAWAIFGLLYNVAEGLISTWWGVSDETLTLFGFGVDSFIEAISAVGIAFMVLRIWRDPAASRSPGEMLALRITGGCFYILAASLVVGGAISLWQGSSPKSTWGGVLVSCASLAVMGIMLWSKLKIGRELGSRAMVADAKCTQVCIYMSAVLLAASGLYELTGIGWLDPLGTWAIAWFSYREGVEAFEHAAGHECCDCGH